MSAPAHLRQDGSIASVLFECEMIPREQLILAGVHNPTLANLAEAILQRRRVAKLCKGCGVPQAACDWSTRKVVKCCPDCSHEGNH